MNCKMDVYKPMWWWCGVRVSFSFWNYESKHFKYKWRWFYDNLHCVYQTDCVLSYDNTACIKQIMFVVMITLHVSSTLCVLSYNIALSNSFCVLSYDNTFMYQTDYVCCHIDVLVQEICNSSAFTDCRKRRLSCTNPCVWYQCRWKNLETIVYEWFCKVICSL